MDSYGRIGRQIALMLFIFGIFGLLLPDRESGPPMMRSMQAFSITGHMMIFFLGAYLIYAFRPGFSARLLYSQFLLILGAALLVSIITEGLQLIIPGRTGSLRDVVTNVTGAMIFLVIKNQNHVKRVVLLNASVTSITIILFWPFFRAVSDEIIAYRQFPLLAGFETPFEATRFTGDPGSLSVSDEYAYTGRKSLRVKFGTQVYSGMAMEYMPGDWRGFSYLQFAVYNPHKKEVALHSRIHDTHHADSGRMLHTDRFNHTFIIQPETWTVVPISLNNVKNSPRNREMVMEQVVNIGFFVAQETEPLTLYIDDIRLKNQTN
jgi:hypothetical protein